MNRLKQKYQQEIKPQLLKELKLENVMSAPKIEKIVVNIGVTDPADAKERRKALENISKQIAIITGQKPYLTIARKAISEFALQQGDPMGLKVTLRGERMWQFIDKLIAIVLPRVKDFRGVSRTAFDGQGNYSLGIEEQIVFPAINYDEIEKIRGLQIVFVTNTNNDKHSFKLLELLGMPFAKEE